MRERLRAAPAWAWLAALVLFSWCVRFAFARHMVGPWIMIDEIVYSELAKSFAATGHFAVREARLREGFTELVQACKDRGAPFYLASGGLRQYIEAVLEAHLDPELRAFVRVRCPRTGSPRRCRSPR